MPRLLFTLAIAVACAVFLPEGRVSSQADRIDVDAIAARVTIRRDTFGVPHILARDDEAAGFGLGYAQAEDHAAEMGRRYLLARGDAARWFGARFLDNDLAMKRLRNREGAQEALATSGEGYRRWLRGFAAGMNAYVQAHRAELPAWIPVITEADVIAHGHRDTVLTALRPPPTRNRGASAAEVADAEGSNALAIAGSRTESGKPILLANPHLRWSALYWEAHVTVPGQYNFYGSLTVGLAALRAGFNEHLGYAQTNNAPDLVDHYAVPLDTPARYRFNGETRPFRRQAITVDVMQADGQVEPVTREFLATDFGPVVQMADTHAIVSRSETLDAWRYHEGFYDLLRARDLESFQAIMARQLIPQSNFTYADAAGNIQYLWNARIPRRTRTDVDYAGVVPGDDDRYFFRGVHALSELPRVLNPPRGTVQNANNAPWFATTGDRLNPSDFPNYFERRDLALRPQVALLELERREKFTVDDVRRLKFDTQVLLAHRVLPELFAAANVASGVSRDGQPAVLTDDVRQGIALLRAWDRRMQADSRGAVLFITFWNLYDQGRPQPFRVAWDEARPVETPTGLADTNAALAALAKAVAVVREKHGSPDVAWGDVHRHRFGDDTDLPADGGPGGYGLYRVMSFDDTPDGKAVAGRPGYAAEPTPAGPIAGSGDGWVLLMHFTQPVTAYSVLAYGQADSAASRHSADQIRLFAKHELRPVWFSEADIRANLEREYHPGAPAGDSRRTDTYVESDAGVRIFVREVAPPASSRTATALPPMLLVHGGGPGGLASFDLDVPGYSLASDFARAGHHVYVMNVRGWEQSTRPLALDRPANANAPAVTFADASRDIRAVVEWIRKRRGGAKVALVGWASGGHWAGAYASAGGHATSLSHLVLLNTIYGVDAPWPLSSACAERITDAYRLADGRALRGRWDSSIPEPFRAAWRDPHVADAMIERVLALDPTSDVRTPSSARVPLAYFAESCAMTTGSQLWDAAAITTPTLVIRGERDFWSRPADLTALERTLGSRARSRFVTIPDATHHLFLDRPDRGRQQFIDETLRFLASAER